MSNDGNENPQSPWNGLPVDGQAAAVDKSNPYGVGVTAASGGAPEPEDLAKYQTLRSGLVLIVSSHFVHVSMVLLMMYIVFSMMNLGASIGGTLGNEQGADVGGEIGGVVGTVFATCCAWFFLIVSGPLNFIGGCLGFSIPDITGAKSKVTGSVVSSALAILGWVAVFMFPEFGMYDWGTGFFMYCGVLLGLVFASHAFFVWALHDVGVYLGRRDVCSTGFATVAVSGLCFLLILAGFGMLLRLEGWKESAIPGSSSGMWLLAGVLALVWLGMYIRLLFVSMNSLKSVGPPRGPKQPLPIQPQPVQPLQAGIPVAQTPTRKGW